MNGQAPTFGDLLRQWRTRRARSQLVLACDAEVSQRHLSFLESGRSTPSREMVLRLAEHLSVPLRDRNALLAAAGYAPVYGDRPVDDPEMAAALAAVRSILQGHEPFPALAVDRHWTLLFANSAIESLTRGVAASLLDPPVNVLRLSLHPDGMAPAIANYREWRAHVLGRLNHQIDVSGDPVLQALHDELRSYPVPAGAAPWRPSATAIFPSIAVPLQLRTADGVLSFLSATTVFGTAVDIGLSELAIETFFPADEITSSILLRR